jgi:hypothetical protein
LEFPQNATLIPEGLSDEDAAGEAAAKQGGEKEEGGGELFKGGSSTSQTQHVRLSVSATHALRTHLKYASGQMIPRPALCALFAANYHNPAVLDLLQSMTRAVRQSVPCMA